MKYYVILLHRSLREDVRVDGCTNKLQEVCTFHPASHMKRSMHPILSLESMSISKMGIIGMSLILLASTSKVKYWTKYIFDLMMALHKKVHGLPKLLIHPKGNINKSNS